MPNTSYPSIASTSSFAPVLINPNPTNPPPSAPTPPAPNPAPALILKYPYPLALISLLDLSYTAYHWSGSNDTLTPSLLFVLCGIRIVVLGLMLGCSVRWRDRGGWVGVSSGGSLGGSIWVGCVRQLQSGSGTEIGIGKGKGKGEVWFLVVTALISIFEYLLFLLLLRLSPPPHRSHPFAIRLPRSAIQSPTAFSFQAKDEYTSPTRRRWSQSQSQGQSERWGHRRWSSRHSGLSNLASGSTEIDPDPDEEDEEDLEEDEDGTSSISESSIIDLPPPLSPNRIIPPSISLNRGLDRVVLDLERSPVVGPLVRRTRSARFLGRGSVRDGNEPGERRTVSGAVSRGMGLRDQPEEGEDGGEGYGTFG